MKSRAGLFLTCAAAFVGAIAIAPQALAQSAEETWFRGYFEVGGRVFANNPERDGIASRGGQSLAKFYEYSTLAPGPFVDLKLATGTKDGLYRADFWGTNIGYSDQAYWLNLSKAGEHYVTFGWDQTPHVYSTSARTLYNGVGTNALTLPAGLGTQFYNCVHNTSALPGICNGLLATAANPLSAPNAAKVQALIDANAHQTDIGIRRDTASVEYRWTPTDLWDVRASYSNMRRSGTQIDSAVMSWSTSGVTVEVPKPVDDTTQIFGLSGEYAGTSFWGQKFNLKLAYSGSIYQENLGSFTVQNPFCQDGGACPFPGAARDSYNFAGSSIWPDNQAHAYTATLGAELPFKSRYMGTLSYTTMRQNEAFLPFTINPNLGLAPNGQPWNSTAALPALSLNGAIDTLLINNVLTTQITPELKSKLSYRNYAFNNGTPEIFFPYWVGADISPITAPASDFSQVRSLSISYTKQNAGAELNWRPTRQWNVGAAYGWERYDRVRADVDVTNEHSGKIFADWKPTEGIMARASWFYSQRRYGTYDYMGLVGSVQWPDPATAAYYSTSYRQFFLDNRDRNIGKFSVAFDLARNLVVTPTFGLRNDDFNLNPATEVGLMRNYSWNAGVELAYLVSPDTRFLFSYTREHRSQLVASCNNNVLPSANCDAIGTQNYYTADVRDDVDTFIVAADHALIPNRLDLRLSYTFSRAVNSQRLVNIDGTGPTTGGQFPDVFTTFQRLEALLKYKFDENTVRQLGWKGNVTAKLRYVWERNSVTNWNIDSMNTYMYSVTNTTGYMTWMAYDNPNYNVHLIMASLAFAW